MVSRSTMSTSRTSSLSSSQSPDSSRMKPWDEQLLRYRDAHPHDEPPRIRLRTSHHHRHKSSPSRRRRDPTPTKKHHKKTPSDEFVSPTAIQYALPRSHGRAGRSGSHGRASRSGGGGSSNQQRSKSQPPENRRRRQRPSSRDRGTRSTRSANKSIDNGTIITDEDRHDHNNSFHHHHVEYPRRTRSRPPSPARAVAAGCVSTGQTLREHVSHCFMLTTDLYQRGGSGDVMVCQTGDEFSDIPLGVGGVQKRDDNDVFFFKRKHSLEEDDDDDDKMNIQSERGAFSPPEIVNSNSLLGQQAFDPNNKEEEELWRRKGARFPEAPEITAPEATQPEPTIVSPEPIRYDTPTRDTYRRPRGAYDRQDSSPDKTANRPSMVSPLPAATPERERSRTGRANQAPQLRNLRLSMFEHDASVNSTPSPKQEQVERDVLTSDRDGGGGTSPGAWDEQQERDLVAAAGAAVASTAAAESTKPVIAKKKKTLPPSTPLRTRRSTTVDALNTTAVKYSRALEDLAVQDESIQRLQVQLQESQMTLQSMQQELAQAQQASALHQQQAALQNSKAFQNRVGVEERLRRELNLNVELSQKVADMEAEREQMTVELEQARTGAVEIRAWTPPPKRSPYKSSPSSRSGNTLDDSTSSSSSHVSTSELLKLRTTVVELKAQVAEAHAARLSAEASQASLTEKYQAAEQAEQLYRFKLETAQRELVELKQSTETSSSTEDDPERLRLQRELDQIRQELEEARNEITQHVEESQRLQNELDTAMAERTKLQSQLEEASHELEATRKEADHRVHVSEEEAKKLQAELRVVKDKLSATNADIIKQASAHLLEKQQMEEDIQQAREVSDKMRFRLEQMDDEVVRAQNEVEMQRRMLQRSESSELSGSSSSLRRISGDVFQLLKKRTADV